MPVPGETSGGFSTVAVEGMPLIRRQIGLPVYRDRVLVGACGISGSKTDGANETCPRPELPRSLKCAPTP
jgi:uncharacterized protein GlcG (DUF336 family)